MQAQDATTLFFLKAWPWVEANKNRLIAGAVFITIAILSIWFISSQRAQKELAAGQALTLASLSGGGPTQADAYLKIAKQYPGTMPGQRALLLGAAALFEAGKYSDAQAQFQKFLDAYPDNEFSGQAELGVAVCLDAQGKTDLALGAFQRVINSSSDAAVTTNAKFHLARIEESQGRFDDALAFYQDVARANPNGSLGSEAAMRLMELRSKQAAIKPLSTSTAPSK